VPITSVRSTGTPNASSPRNAHFPEAPFVLAETGGSNQPTLALKDSAACAAGGHDRR
jgi:hypothetical protein